MNLFKWTLGLLVLLVSAFSAWAAEAGAAPAAPQTVMDWYALLITAATPLLIAAVKTIVPKMPRVWLPFAAPIIGAGLQTVLNYSGLTSGDTLTGMVLGASGVALREAIDQVKKLGMPVPPSPVLIWGALLTLLAFLPACSHVTLVKDGTKTAFTGTSFLSNTALKGLAVDATTKTTTNALKITGATTEPNPEAITASAEGLGNLIGSAAAATAKGMK